MLMTMMFIIVEGKKQQHKKWNWKILASSVPIVECVVANSEVIDQSLP